MSEGTKTNDPAWESHLAALVIAGKLEEKISAPARAVYEATKEAAWKVYQATTESAVKAYEEAIEPARKIYKDTMDDAENTYRSASETTKRAIDAAKESAQKALDAVKEDDEVTHTEGDVYSVRSVSRFTLTVWKYKDGKDPAWGCTCGPGLDGYECRHKIAVKRWLEAQ